MRNENATTDDFVEPELGAEFDYGNANEEKESRVKLLEMRGLLLKLGVKMILVVYDTAADQLISSVHLLASESYAEADMKIELPDPIREAIDDLVRRHIDEEAWNDDVGASGYGEARICLESLELHMDHT